MAVPILPRMNATIAREKLVTILGFYHAENGIRPCKPIVNVGKRWLRPPACLQALFRRSHYHSFRNLRLANRFQLLRDTQSPGRQHQAGQQARTHDAAIKSHGKSPVFLLENNSPTPIYKSRGIAPA
jgi:hypothetical protein